MAPSAGLSRRSALTGIGAGGLAMTLATRHAAAANTGDLVSHPNVGVWRVESPIGTALAVYSADGSVITALPVTQAGPAGVQYSSTQVGTWEATGERSAHLTLTQLLSDAEGAFAGFVTVDAYQSVSEDGTTFTSEEGSTITISDADGNEIEVIADAPPATGTRLQPGMATPVAS